jgi:hypothetical protein
MMWSAKSKAVFDSDPSLVRRIGTKAIALMLSDWMNTTSQPL